MANLRLEIRHLSMVRYIADLGTVTAAADHLGVTQSALTHRLREAERRLNVPLFSRTGNRLFLTPAGERLYSTAVMVLDDLVRTEEDVSLLGKQQRTVVRLGQGTYNRFHWFPGFIEYLGEPELELDIVARAAREPLTTLLDGLADIVTVHGMRRERRRLRWLRLANDPLVAIMAPSHPMAERDFVTADDFVNERYITYSLEPEPGFEWTRLFRSARQRPRRISVVGVPEAIVDLVRAGLGVSILSQWAVQPEIDDGTLVARPIGQAGLNLDWWVVVRAEEGNDSPPMRVAHAMVAWSQLRQQGTAQLAFSQPGDHRRANRPE
ncbi:MAG: LysR family transcriptional regulator [Proteobacteria bacterium]|nr:MAG: LysR family transcriptional regulator [Pseudomonadota bacterium]